MKLSWQRPSKSKSALARDASKLTQREINLLTTGTWDGKGKARRTKARRAD